MIRNQYLILNLYYREQYKSGIDFRYEESTLFTDR